MFSIYGVSGRLFRGSMEHLRHIGPLSATARTLAVQALGRDAHEAGESGWAGLTPGVQGGAMPSPGDETHRQALAAYVQTQRGEGSRQPLSRVDALMSQTVMTLRDDLTVLQGWRQLVRHGFAQAPVVNQSGVLVGLLSRSNVAGPEHLPTRVADMAAWQELLAQPVTALMVTPVPSVEPDTDVRRVARVLLDTALPGLAVADEQGQVRGFVSRSDILRAVANEPPLDLWG